MLPKLIAEGHKILIFSVWTSCLDLLGCLMEHLGLKFLRMDGSCPTSERQELMDRFNGSSSTKVFLLSTKACGLGINLTSADTCIMHDLDFNPFNDLQAEGMCDLCLCLGIIFLASFLH
jgi:SWI/SNF-related matrix-associated actin-dependent regulator 1 of chromatin subfamily A